MEIKYYGDKITHHIAKTPEGFLICQDVPISRTGYQTYLSSEMFEDPENKHRAIPVYRPASEVFDIKSLASFEGKPVTNEHPEEDVKPENYSRYACGHVQNVHVGVGKDANKVLADLYITDPKLIYLIQHGKREISCGYYAEERRDPQGRICQTRIRGNHVAVVKNGRAGRNVCIRDKNPFLLEKNMKRKHKSIWDELDDELLSDDEFGDDELSDDEFGDDELSDDDFGDDEFGDDELSDCDVADDDFGDDELSDDDFGDDELSDDEFGGDEIADDDFGDDELADDELSDDDFGDEELADDDLGDDDLADDEFGDDEFSDDEFGDDEVEESIQVDDPNCCQAASVKEVISDSKKALREINKILRDAKRFMYGKRKRKDAVILSDDELSDDALSDDDLITSDDDLTDDDYLADDDFGDQCDDEFGDDELSDDDLADDELLDEDVSDDELSDDDVADDDLEEVAPQPAETIDPDREKVLREITEASRGISDPNERKQLQDAIYNVLCKKSQMPGIMKLVNKTKKNRTDSVPSGKVSVAQQQSIYDSFNPHKKTSF